MKVDRIEILPLRRENEQCAIIKIEGITDLEPPIRFRLEPVGGTNDDNRADWPEGELIAEDFRAGFSSIDLLVGPDVLKAPALRAGTLVAFRVPAADIDAVVVWPDLGPIEPDSEVDAAEEISEPETSSAEVSEGGQAADDAAAEDATAPEPAEHEPAEDTAVAIDKAADAAPEDDAADDGEDAVVRGDRADAAAVAAQPSNVVELNPAKPDAAVKSEIAEPEAGAATPEQAENRSEPDTAPKVENTSDSSDSVSRPRGGQGLARLRVKAGVDDTEDDEDNGNEDNGNEDKGDIVNQDKVDNEDDKKVASDQAGQAEAVTDRGGAAAKPKGAGVGSQAAASASAKDKADTGKPAKSIQPAGATPPPLYPQILRPSQKPKVDVPRRANFGAAAGPLWLPAVLILVIIGALQVIVWRAPDGDTAAATLFGVQGSAEGTGAAVRSSNPAATLGTLFQSAEVSPAGYSAGDVPRQDALLKANEHLSLQNPTAEERSEAAFWLKRALSLSLSEPRLVWALTQLGTAYAAGEGTEPSDYRSAGMLWSWASAAGDAYSSCFLGELYERGLGVAADRNLALRQFQLARDLGGCPGLEQALLRLKE